MEKTAETDGTIIEFLNGSHSYDGVWFGDKHRTKEGVYWWRKILRDYVEASQFKQPSAWISVEDSLPENENEVLVVHTEAGGVSIGFYSDDLKRWVSCDTDIERNGQILVTHWQQLPKPPIK